MSMEWFGTLPRGDWQAVRLKRLVKWWTLKKEYEEGETYIGLENIEPWTGRIIPSEDGTLTLTTSEETTSIGACFKAGDVLFSKLRPYLAKAFLAESDGLCSTELLVLQPGPDIYGRFLLYVLLTPSFIDLVNSSAFGSKMPRAEWDFIGDIPIPLPPLRQQQHLAALLDRETTRLDQLVAAKQTQLALIAEKRRALITRAVTQGLDAAAPRRATGLPWLEEVPAHWEVVRLKDVSHSLQTGPFGSQLHAEDYIDGGIPVINPAHLRGGRIIPDEKVTVSDETSERLAMHRLEVGDVIFARRGELGRCSVVTEAEAGWLCGTGCLRARIDMTRLRPAFLQLFVEYTEVPNWLSVQSVGSTMENLNTEILGNLHVCFPSVLAQKITLFHIAQENEEMDNLQSLTETSLALMHERRAALVAAAVTGELEITAA